MGYLDTRAKGRIAEDLAVVFLVGQGLRILGRNAHYRFGEIDILAADLDEKCLVIIEVKAKSGSRFGAPIEMISQSKRRTLVKLAKWIFAQYNKPVRIDVVTIEHCMSPNPHIVHYPCAIGE